MNMLPKPAAHDNMINSQIRTGHVLDPRILEALSAVAREAYVPEPFRGAAYADKQIPLGSGRFMMEPLDFARLLKHAATREEETVLNIACAAGYSAAILSRLARHVVVVEEDVALAKIASVALASLSNVTFREGPLAAGCPAHAPYDLILIGGAIEYLPQSLADQLREGGRVLAGEHDAEANVGVAGLSKLVRYTKVQGGIYKTALHDCDMAALDAFRRPRTFKL